MPLLDEIKNMEEMIAQIETQKQNCRRSLEESKNKLSTSLAINDKSAVREQLQLLYRKRGKSLDEFSWLGGDELIEQDAALREQRKRLTGIESALDGLIVAVADPKINSIAPAHDKGEEKLYKQDIQLKQQWCSNLNSFLSAHRNDKKPAGSQEGKNDNLKGLIDEVNSLKKQKIINEEKISHFLEEEKKQNKAGQCAFAYIVAVASGSPGSPPVTPVKRTFLPPALVSAFSKSPEFTFQLTPYAEGCITRITSQEVKIKQAEEKYRAKCEELKLSLTMMTNYCEMLSSLSQGLDGVKDQLQQAYVRIARDLDMRDREADAWMKELGDVKGDKDLLLGQEKLIQIKVERFARDCQQNSDLDEAHLGAEAKACKDRLSIHNNNINKFRAATEVAEKTYDEVISKYGATPNLTRAREELKGYGIFLAEIQRNQQEMVDRIAIIEREAKLRIEQRNRGKKEAEKEDAIRKEKDAGLPEKKARYIEALDECSTIWGKLITTQIQKIDVKLLPNQILKEYGSDTNVNNIAAKLAGKTELLSLLAKYRKVQQLKRLLTDDSKYSQDTVYLIQPRIKAFEQEVQKSETIDILTLSRASVGSVIGKAILVIFAACVGKYRSAHDRFFGNHSTTGGRLLFDKLNAKPVVSNSCCAFFSASNKGAALGSAAAVHRGSEELHACSMND